MTSQMKTTPTLGKIKSNLQYYVYVWIDPRDDSVFYVGKGSGGRVGQKGRTSRNRFFQSVYDKILREGLEPYYEVIAESNDEDFCLSYEAQLIKSYGRRQDGGTLTNLSFGGKGNSQYVFDDWFFDNLGKISDTDIAEKYGCDRGTVSYYRNHLGIPCLPSPNKVPPPPMGGWNKIDVPDECIALIGHIPDRKLADMFGIGRDVLRRTRKELGLKSYVENTGDRSVFKKGEKNHLDKTIRVFQNIKTGEVFKGTRWDFSEHIGVNSNNLGALIAGRNKTAYGWRLIKDE